MSNISDITRIKRVALEAVFGAGKVLKKDFYKKKKNVSLKEDGSYFTQSDLRAEKKIFEVIRKTFPDHAILSEESGGELGDGYSWIADPLDGTTNFTRAIPIFSVSLAFLHQKKPILAVVFNPVAGELYVAQKGRGTFLNDKRIHVSLRRDPRLILTAFTGLQKNPVKWFSLVRRIVSQTKSLRIFGSSNLEFCQVAKGEIDGCISFEQPPWDFLPGSFMVEEAGGRVTDFDGNPFTIESNSVLATNARIHRQTLRLIRG